MGAVRPWGRNEDSNIGTEVEGLYSFGIGWVFAPKGPEWVVKILLLWAIGRLNFSLKIFHRWGCDFQLMKSPLCKDNLPSLSWLTPMTFQGLVLELGELLRWSAPMVAIILTRNGNFQQGTWASIPTITTLIGIFNFSRKMLLDYKKT